VFLAIKMATEFVGILPLTLSHAFDRREGLYGTLLMSTGLTFGSISALFGLANRIIDQTLYTILVTAVIGSAVVPTLIAQAWFQPDFKTIADATDVVEAEESASEAPQRPAGCIAPPSGAASMRTGGGP
jgi:Kef-type K+ transport system membrane component KefB